MNPSTTSIEMPTAPAVTDPPTQPRSRRGDPSRQRLASRPATSMIPIIISR
jgi:hypothetical protein